MAETMNKPEDNQEGVRLIIAGGGTGGHLFPGLAIGREVKKRRPGSEIIFVTGIKSIESNILGKSGFKQESINISGLKGIGWKKGLKTLFKIPIGIYQSIRIIKRVSPHMVLGVGGYSSGPACLAAKMVGVPTAIHEQNTYPGLTNRLLCRVVDRVFISFEESRKHFSKGDLLLTGNPVREEFQLLGQDKENSEERFTLLVMGGSQGARAINRAFIEALEILKAGDFDVSVIHQTGVSDFEEVKQEYDRKGFVGEVVPFINDMADAYGKADMVINRAGATTVSELAAIGKPSILVPYPFAANNHQETNARILEKVGGSVVVLQKDLDGDGLAELIVKYMKDRPALIEMGLKAREAGMPDAVRTIVDEIERVAFENRN